MQTRRFQRRREDFVCENCGAEVKGTGYTNHCPHCLWSKHVDMNPGDRLATCHGLMEPVGLDNRNGSWAIIHRCTRCHFTRQNQLQEGDSFDAALRLSSGAP